MTQVNPKTSKIIVEKRRLNTIVEVYPIIYINAKILLDVIGRDFRGRAKKNAVYNLGTLHCFFELIDHMGIDIKGFGSPGGGHFIFMLGP
jgi:hypothetical protein